MLLFNNIRNLYLLYPGNFNTSNVTIQLQGLDYVDIAEEYFNTSNVTIQLAGGSRVKRIKINFNTSNVTIQRFQMCSVKTLALFQYI